MTNIDDMADDCLGNPIAPCHNWYDTILKVLGCDKVLVSNDTSTENVMLVESFSFIYFTLGNFLNVALVYSLVCTRPIFLCNPLKVTFDEYVEIDLYLVDSQKIPLKWQLV